MEVCCLQKFTAKKARVRMSVVDSTRTQLVFGTSVWIGFTSEDERGAERLLGRLL
ncbi:hypothetical protein [Hyperthermus butylicus]|uniref:hypothetical protein n=1 Tax=Hyperthermus butylicus TaxID=54248 RepID=UPI00129A62A7|nr:hypothetical protein [Hyperthermus butylicus]